VKERTVRLENAYDELFEKSEMINRQKQEIEKHHSQLELKVQERTQDLILAKQKAEESDRLKSSFLANMSHEIRTPLNAITGFSALVCSDHYTPEKKEKYVDIIKSNASSLLKLVEDILYVSKIEAGQLTIVKKHFDFQQMMAELHAVYSEELKAKNKPDVNLVYDPPVDKPGRFTFYSDYTRIKQVISNLLGNAVKFTFKGSITFGYQPGRDSIRFWVRDTGIGIAEKDLDNIFNRFFKIEEDNAVYRGTGLGLSISKSLVMLLGGRIWVESKLNEGSCFFFEIPGKIKWQLHSAIDKPEGQPELNLDHLKILIVEDERSNYELLHSYFTGTGADVTWASDGAIAVSFCETQRFDLILMDIRMPEMDGYQTLARIRELWPKVPAIAQTAFAQAEDLEKIEHAGFNDFLIKPFFREELFAKISKIL
jgi:signal transduction histidine kinase